MKDIKEIEKCSQKNVIMEYNALCVCVRMCVCLCSLYLRVIVCYRISAF